MLLNSFEEQFHTPSIPVEFGNQFCRGLQIIRQENISGSTIGLITNWHYFEFVELTLNLMEYNNEW